MRKLALVVHTSLDGFVAGSKGELDGFDKGTENLAFVCELIQDADTALFGRISYQLLNSYWPGARNIPKVTKEEIDYSNWYNNAKKIVVSKTIAEDLHGTTIIRNDIPAQVSRILEQPGKNILIFGSPSVAQILMQHDLIDSYWIFINPVIFGKGIPLFTELPGSLQLTLVSTKHFPNGEIALNYISNGH